MELAKISVIDNESLQTQTSQHAVSEAERRTNSHDNCLMVPILQSRKLSAKTFQ